jgi:hypothetical protein
VAAEFKAYCQGSGGGAVVLQLYVWDRQDHATDDVPRSGVALSRFDEAPDMG